jgi:endonuclease G, mitochondrial
MKLKFIAIMLLPLTAMANPIDDQCPQFVTNGAPISALPDTVYLCKHHYAINYRKDTKTPEYVVEHPSKKEVTGPAKRKDDFRADPSISPEFQSQLSDYAGQPYDRGHLVPAGDSTENATDMSESFYLSNMVPQVPNNNRGIWKQLETYVRNNVTKGKDIYVISGTIYKDGYTSIGDHKVGVPTHVWKVMIDNSSKKSIAFLFPNAAIPVADLPNYAITVDQLEKETGIDISPSIDESIEQKMDVKDWLQ